MEVNDSLKEVHLRYSSDEQTGYNRKKVGEIFKYYDKNETEITDETILLRIKNLGIPPAWKDVWICKLTNGHIQATGYDSKKRKQYRYHERWTKMRQENKFLKMLDFVQVLPKIRKQVRHDLALEGLPREKISATVVWLLENTLIRIGNEEYERENDSHGLTTLENKHVAVKGNNIRFLFKGKSGVYHDVKAQSKKVARIIRRCQELPGQHLFEYINDEGTVESIDSYDINEYLKTVAEMEITAKDFRTWGGTITAAQLLCKVGLTNDEQELKKNLTEVSKKVAAHLGNKPATCRKYYIHPLVFKAYSKGYILTNIMDLPESKKYVLEELDHCEGQVYCLLSYFSKQV